MEATIDQTALETPRDLRWPSLAIPSPNTEVTVGWASPELRLTRIVPIADTQSDTNERVDFWSLLTGIELESRMSRVGAAIFGQEKLPVCSRIDERDHDSRALLTDSVRRLAPILHAIIASKAARANLPIEEAYFEVDRDDEEDSRQLVIVVQVQANAAQTLAFWNSLDYEIDRWLVQLKPADQEIVTNRLGLRFAWDGSGGG